MNKLTVVKGFHDVLPPDSERFTAVETRVSDVLRSYNYREIRTPIAERTELFARSLGETSDVVEKEMYTFDDRDGSQVTLRPEGTASIVRAAIDAGLAQKDQTAKLFYLGPMFRRERPQKGRYRQFHQIGAELIGRDDPLADAEVVTLLADCLAAAGVAGATLLLNSLGDAACRPAYREALTAFGRAHVDALCPTCRQRLDRNPLRLLDCKEEGCRKVMADAPLMPDHLCEPCRTHFAEVRALLDAAQVAYELRPRLVRGLDYYVRTAFEAVAAGLGSQNAVGGGGRYDGLVAALGGPAVPGIGFALGLDRLVMAAPAEAAAGNPEVCVIALAAAAGPVALRVARSLRSAGTRCEVEASGKSLKSAMRRADRLGAHYALLVGEDELRAGKGTLRDMRRQADHRLAVGLQESGPTLVEAIREIGEAAAHG